MAPKIIKLILCQDLITTCFISDLCQFRTTTTTLLYSSAQDPVHIFQHTSQHFRRNQFREGRSWSLKALASLPTCTHWWCHPLQFTYNPCMGADDAVTFLLYQALPHFEMPGIEDCVLWISAFCTTQQALLRDKLEQTVQPALFSLNTAKNILVDNSFAMWK